VEGCARRTTREYLQFLNVANGSTAEAAYLVDVACRLGFVPESVKADLMNRYTDLTKGLQKLIASLEHEP